MRHRACDCPSRRHRLIRVSFTSAVLVLVAVAALRVGTAVGSADLIARTAGSTLRECADDPLAWGLMSLDLDALEGGGSR